MAPVPKNHDGRRRIRRLTQANNDNVIGPSMMTKSAKEYMIILGYLFSVTIVVLNHELWRDEFQAWLIALKSGSLTALFTNLRYEGHPGLWHFCLYLITRFTDDPFFMQIFHICLAGITIWLLVRFSPFTLLQKFLISFGYFNFYEYAVISRNYIFGVMFVFLFCAVYSRRQDAVLLLSVILAFLAQTNFYGVLLSLLLAALIIFESVFNAELREKLLLLKKHCFIAGILFAIAIYFSLFQIIPPDDTGYFQGWHFNFSRWRLAEAIQMIWRPFVPLHSMDTHFWYTSLLKSFHLRFYLSVILFFVTTIYFIRTPAIFICYILCIFGYVSFSYIKMMGEINHNGYIFIFFMSLLWLRPYFTHIKYKPKYMSWLTAKPQIMKLAGSLFLLLILMTHFFGGVTAAIIDIKYPFSASKDVFKYLKKENKEDKVLAGDKDYAITSIVGYLNKEIYYPRKGDFGTFIIWNIKRNKEYDVDDILKNIFLEFNEVQEDGILIFNYELKDNLVSKYNLKKIKEFKESIVWDEKFYLYFIEFPLEQKNK